VDGQRLPESQGASPEHGQSTASGIALRVPIGRRSRQPLMSERARSDSGRAKASTGFGQRGPLNLVRSITLTSDFLRVAAAASMAA